MTDLEAVLDRVARGIAGYDDAMWLGEYIAELRAEVKAWKAWEHSWIFGDDAPWPGQSGTVDPRGTVDTLLRLALDVPEEAWT